MLRIELENGCKEIIELIEKTELTESLKKYITDYQRVPKDGLKLSPALLKSLSLFSNGFQNLTKEGKEICEIFDIEKIKDSDNWVLIFDNADPSAAYELNSNIWFVLKYVPRIMKLLARDSINTEKENKIGRSLLTVIFPEEDSKISNLERISEGLYAIEMMKKIVIDVFSIRDEDLQVVSIDSGSDKIFDFNGSSDIVKEVKEIIFGIWDRIVTNKEKRNSDHLDNIAKSLPIIEKIAEMTESGTLSPEKSEILKRDVIVCVNKYVNSGVVIPELSDYMRFEPRKLMAPEQKLLSGPQEKIDNGQELKLNIANEETSKYIPDNSLFQAELENRSSNVSQKLSEDEIETLRKLINKVNGI